MHTSSQVNYNMDLEPSKPVLLVKPAWSATETTKISKFGMKDG